MKEVDLITRSVPYLHEFTYEQYIKNFDVFFKDFETILAVLNSSDIPKAVTDLIDDIDTCVSDQPRRKQKETRFQLKQILALFLVPAALKCGVQGERYAGELVRQWNERNPKCPFLMGTYETILEGFDSVFFGMPLRK